MEKVERIVKQLTVAGDHDKINAMIYLLSHEFTLSSQISHRKGRNRVRTTMPTKKPTQAADVFLWRNKKISASVLGGATALWVLFELLQYHLVTLVCHILILVFAVLFLWSNASKFINKSPPRIPEVKIPEDTLLQVAGSIRIEINRFLEMLQDISSGRDLKKFITVVFGLWVLSIVGRLCNFLTLFYTTFVLLHIVPVLYEKYEDEVDAFAEKAMIEMKKQYAVIDRQLF